MPFDRVTVNKSKEPEGPNEMVDFAGVSWTALFSGVILVWWFRFLQVSMMKPGTLFWVP